jgi:hypothetical protein
MGKWGPTIYHPLYLLHPVMYHISKVYLRAASTTIYYKIDIKMFVIWFIYNPLHVSVCRDQVVHEYTSVIIELSIKMDPYFTFTNII